MTSPYDFSPLLCQDCGRESGQMFIDRGYDNGDLIVCLDCMLARDTEAKREEEEEA